MKLHFVKTSNFLIIALMAVFFALASQNVQASGLTSEEVLDLVNKARIKENLAPLKINENLEKAAEEKIEDMIKNDYFAHKSPGGVDPWFWFKKNGYDYKYAGENLAINFLSAQEQQEGWMKSETHRKNILDPNYNETGIAVQKTIINGKLTIITVQEFGLQNVYAMAAQGKVAGAEFMSRDFSQNNFWSVKNFSDLFLTLKTFPAVWIFIAIWIAILLIAKIGAVYIRKKYETILFKPEILAMNIKEYLELLPGADIGFGQMDAICPKRVEIHWSG